MFWDVQVAEAYGTMPAERMNPATLFFLSFFVNFLSFLEDKGVVWLSLSL